ncbi:hypothetical protein [Nostoc sp.]|uniref:hypothetical protein n=1 Tax=Nostoc sp. TaxID=1180 RepID=UPI002FFB437E
MPNTTLGEAAPTDPFGLPWLRPTLGEACLRHAPRTPTTPAPSSGLVLSAAVGAASRREASRDAQAKIGTSRSRQAAQLLERLR